MHEKRFDVVIVGGGIVGLSVALEAQSCGRTVAIVDPGSAEGRASYGNAGVLSRGSIFPMAGPGIRSRLPRYAMGRDIAVRARLRSLPFLLPWLTRFLLAANEDAWRRSAAALNPMVAQAFDRHVALADLVGGRHLIKRNGWLRLYRSQQAFDGSVLERQVLAENGVRIDCLGDDEIRQLEPHLAHRFSNGIFFPDTGSVESPGELVELYRQAAEARGATFVAGTADAISQLDGCMAVYVGGERIEGSHVVLAAGARSAALARSLGYRFPLAAERGYHRHFELAEGIELRRPVYDAAGGYVLSPMNGKVRLLSGVELARPDDPGNATQIESVEPDARKTLRFTAPVEEKPWLGSRPSTPDGLPVIGRAVRHPHLIFAFGHGHIGFANGPMTGDIVAGLIKGERAAFPIDAFSPARFGC
ncbi:NAD(P)/FAD-dependent oxidoreductase [Aminobacter sp. HY435]|uniref:NAD(P)/FAD-dependent oxidoreductase n=1 Tax=Aminobacter sp. HY435 TaxID=2970917 RepID=UPI0022B98409|nr:FAD-dependent oxidoreductase [Aminobacter sp. HY435]